MDITAICGFLLLMSDGLYEAYSSCTKSAHTVNQDLGQLVQAEMDRCTDLFAVAQQVVNAVKTDFYAMLINEQRRSRMDDITLIVRNLGYPLGKRGILTAPSIVTAPPTTSNPFQFPQHHLPSTYSMKPQQQLQQHPQQQQFMQQQQQQQLHQHQQLHHHQQQQQHRFDVKVMEYSGYYNPPHPGPDPQLGMRRSGSYPSITHEPIRPNLPPSPSSGAIADSTGIADEPYNVLNNQLSPHVQPFSQGKTNQSDLYPPPSQTADGWSGASNIPDQLPVYENVHPKQRRSTDSGNELGLSHKMAGLHMSGEPHIPTNADPQYHTEPDQPVFPPPSPSQGPQVFPPPSKSQGPQVFPPPSPSQGPQVNSIPNSPSHSASDNPSTTNEDYSWMYDKSHQRNPEPPLPDDAPTPMENVVKLPGVPSEGMVERLDGDLTSNADNKTVTPVSGSAPLGSISELDVAVINISPETNNRKDEEDGMIRPIIKFDKFPPDLSWDQI